MALVVEKFTKRRVNVMNLRLYPLAFFETKCDHIAYVMIKVTNLLNIIFNVNKLPF